MHDVGRVMGEGFKAGGAVLGFVNLAGAEAVQQRAQDSPHMGVVVDDEKTQAVEINADHRASQGGATAPDPAASKLRFCR